MSKQKFSLNALTVGEAAKVEDLSGQRIAEFSDGDIGKASTLFIAGLAFVWLKRSEPATTWNDVLGMDYEAMLGILGQGDTDDEQEDADAGPFGVLEETGSGS